MAGSGVRIVLPIRLRTRHGWYLFLVASVASFHHPHQCVVPKLPATFSIAAGANDTVEDESVSRLSGCVVAAVAELDRAFGQSWGVLDPETGRLLSAPDDMLSIDYCGRAALCSHVVDQGVAEPLEDASPVLLIGVPLPPAGAARGLLAVTAVLTDVVKSSEDVNFAAEALGVDLEAVQGWARHRTVWPANAAVATARALSNSWRDRLRLQAVRSQLADVSSSLLTAFEELTLLHRLTDRLAITDNGNELAELAAEWLAEVIPAECLMVYWRNCPEGVAHCRLPDAAPCFVHRGREVVASERVPELIDSLGEEGTRRCLIYNRELTAKPEWRLPEVRELISVPIRPNGQVEGWLLAINRRFDSGGLGIKELGAVEASLMASVAAILSVHAGNIGLYRKQKNFFAQVVRALSSAIDAKDRYTCGHSDRVARIAVHLGRELGLSTDELNTLYLSGLLHDIGKIGIADDVLRKPGELTTQEYEHIKQHPELGYKILQGVEQLDDVLPVVLHHHEAWDGAGYPAGLVGEECPRLARIVAVADSIDAMGSDRPYRKGMPEEKLEAILRNGAGQQWDPEVVAAYLASVDEVRRIVRSDRDPLSLDVGSWHGDELSPLAAGV